MSPLRTLLLAALCAGTALAAPAGSASTGLFFDDFQHASLDGLAAHGGRNYPMVRMSLNFNMWFSPGGMQPVSFPPRIYEQDVDWVLHVQGTALNPAQVEAQVNRLRTNEVSAMDTIGTSEPELASTCDF